MPSLTWRCLMTPIYSLTRKMRCLQATSSPPMTACIFPLRMGRLRRRPLSPNSSHRHPGFDGTQAFRDRLSWVGARAGGMGFLRACRPGQGKSPCLPWPRPLRARSQPSVRTVRSAGCIQVAITHPRRNWIVLIRRRPGWRHSLRTFVAYLSTG